MILEMIQVKKVKWCMNKTQFKISQIVHFWLAQLDKHQTSKPFMISVIGSMPTGNLNFC